MEKRRSLKVILLDDVKEVRQLIAEFLTPHDITVRTAGNSADLLHALRAERFDAALLDIHLSEGTIGEAYDLFLELFPGTELRQAEILADLAATPEDLVSGKYILPMLKAISPKTEAIMLTSTWDGLEDEGFLRKWGSYTTVLKLAPDSSFESRDDVMDLGDELIGFLKKIRRSREARTA